jgi:hypothetical protein
LRASIRPLGAHEGSLQIDREHVVPFGIGDLQEWPSKPYAGVVDQDVDATEFILHGREQPVHIRGQSNISFSSQCLSADLLRAFGYLPGAIFVDVGDDEVCAGPGKRFGNSGADAPASPGYDSHLTA